MFYVQGQITECTYQSCPVYFIISLSGLLHIQHISTSEGHKIQVTESKINSVRLLVSESKFVTNEQSGGTLIR